MAACKSISKSRWIVVEGPFSSGLLLKTPWRDTKQYLVWCTFCYLLSWTNYCIEKSLAEEGRFHYVYHALHYPRSPYSQMRWYALLGYSLHVVIVVVWRSPRFPARERISPRDCRRRRKFSTVIRVTLACLNLSREIDGPIRYPVSTSSQCKNGLIQLIKSWQIKNVVLMRLILLRQAMS